MAVTQFWTMTIGVNLTFMPHHFIGLNGMPRRYALVPDAFSYRHSIRSLGRTLSLIRVALFMALAADAVACATDVLQPDIPGGREASSTVPLQLHT